MWYEDLTECDYFGEEFSNIFTSVGWLQSEKPFQTGKSSKEFYERLIEQSKNPWIFCVFCGPHECDLCQFVGESGSLNIFIPHNGKIYVCPQLITHYINAHHYLPPTEFIEAVLACPPQCSMEYLKKILENGGRQLVRFMKENK